MFNILHIDKNKKLLTTCNYIYGRCIAAVSCVFQFIPLACKSKNLAQFESKPQI